MERLGLDEQATGSVYDALDAAGIEIDDDCGNGRETARYRNGQLAAATADALGLFLDEMSEPWCVCAYGIDGGKPVGIAEAARRLRVRPQRVKELERQALERLAAVRELRAA